MRTSPGFAFLDHPVFNREQEASDCNIDLTADPFPGVLGLDTIFHLLGLPGQEFCATGTEIGLTFDRFGHGFRLPDLGRFHPGRSFLRPRRIRRRLKNLRCSTPY
ncbi:hypothetical protein DCO57_09255 [Labrenzia sp. 011]|nr:hypothetical protein DCO57_09255 [Labrenzia sp. 011]